MALSLQPDDVGPAPFTARTPLGLSEETQAGLMVVIIPVLIVFLGRTWRQPLAPRSLGQRHGAGPLRCPMV